MAGGAHKRPLPHGVVLGPPPAVTSYRLAHPGIPGLQRTHRAPAAGSVAAAVADAADDLACTAVVALPAAIMHLANLRDLEVSGGGGVTALLELAPLQLLTRLILSPNKSWVLP